MAGSLVNEYSPADANLTSLMDTTDKTRIGLHEVSLTEYTTTTVPAIAAGSKLEVNGALYEFASDEALGGAPSNGTVYIKTIPAGASITAVMVNAAPVWDDEKQGWYSSTGGEENYRYLEFSMLKTAAVYSAKGRFFHGQGSLIEKHYATGSLVINNLYAADGTFTGAVSCTALTPTSIVGGVTLFSTVTLLTGALDADSDTIVAFPAGYTKSNSMIISWCVVSAGGTHVYPGYFGDAGNTYNLRVSFINAGDGVIDITVGSQYYENSYTYKILLARVS